MTQAEFRTAVTDEVGDLSDLLENTQIDRWVNEGRASIGFLDHKTAAITWDVGDLEVDLPADLLTLSTIRGRDVPYLGHYVKWGQKLVLDTEDGASGAGSATLMYRAYYPEIDGSNASQLPLEGDRALISYALYRFFNMLASSRSNYRRYSTLVGQNAVTMDDLQAEADRHYDDFSSASANLPPETGVTWFGGA